MQCNEDQESIHRKYRDSSRAVSTDSQARITKELKFRNDVVILIVFLNPMIIPILVIPDVVQRRSGISYSLNRFQSNWNDVVFYSFVIKIQEYRNK